MPGLLFALRASLGFPIGLTPLSPSAIPAVMLVGLVALVTIARVQTEAPWSGSRRPRDSPSHRSTTSVTDWLEQRSCSVRAAIAAKRTGSPNCSTWPKMLWPRSSTGENSPQSVDSPPGSATESAPSSGVNDRARELTQ
jgi:hypothetical protein